MFKLKGIRASTRGERKGPAIADWVLEKLEDQNDFEIELLDLKTIDLPMMNEPNHPRLKKYQHQHTRDWSAKIEPADAFIFVIPEYNFGFTAPIKNALDYVFNEWQYKAVAFVSYGGLAAGTRAVQMLKLVVTELKMMPMMESVNIPFFAKYIDANGKFNADEVLNKSFDDMMTELLRWTKGLKAIRENNLQ
jgi:NAD(P)H-dependent FMN reductase